MTTIPEVVRVAVPAPLRATFDYLPPAAGAAPCAGMRVWVPFGRRRAVGVVTAVGVTAAVARDRLRAIERCIDSEPVVDDELRRLLDWVAGYYHHPVGAAYAAALPVLLRRGAPAARARPLCWSLTASGREQPLAALRRAPRQQQLLARLAAGPVADAELKAELPRVAPVLKRLLARGYIEAQIQAPPELGPGQPGPQLHPEQVAALAVIRAAPAGFAVTLVQGVTGSGKTEVYLQLLEQLIAAGQQALVLVPEIGLTPQLIARFVQRLGSRLTVLHSGLTPVQRLDGWLAARAGEAHIVLGTRSAVFTPLPRLGLVVIDEEHDPSFKQQDGLRYSARDVAVKRAQLAGVPVVLGSATPALETLHNASAGRYRRARLKQRAAGAALPATRLLDVRSRHLDEGLSAPLLERVRAHLEAGGQALLFLNRRGFAPALVCHDCGWIAGCRRCEAAMTSHRGGRSLRCHHCGAARPAATACEACGGKNLIAVGEGTERVAAALRARLPGVAVLRFDRDTTQRKGSLERLLAQVRDGHAQVLVGTQMLAKGHDFPRLTLVGVVNADHGLFSSDFRAAERMAQLVTQVAGRAGRGQTPGEVLLQTRHPDHPLLRTLVRDGYEAFAAAALAERAAAAMPPHGYLALLQAESPQAAAPGAFLDAALAAAEALRADGVAFWGPAPAPLERRAGRSRAQLLVHAERRGPLHRLLTAWIPLLAELPQARRVRWAIDVDPQDLT